MENLEPSIKKESQEEQYETFPDNFEVKISRANFKQMKLLIDSGEDVYFLVTKAGEIYLDPEYTGDIMELNHIEADDVLSGGKFFKKSSGQDDKVAFMYDAKKNQKANKGVEEAILNFINNNLEFKLSKELIH